MMLLAAVVLILAFLALSAMVSRVAQLGSVTTQEQDRPILLEVPQVRTAVDDLLVDLQAATPDLNRSTSPRLDQAIEAGLRHLAFLEASRGLSLDFGRAPATPTGAYDGDVSCGDAVIWIHLSDGEVQVEFASTRTLTWTGTGTC
jgi:hypothetical protein